MQELDNVKRIFYDGKTYVPPKSAQTCDILVPLISKPPRWYQTCKTIREVCYWKGLVTQADMFAKTCKIFQQFKNRNTIYGHLSPKNIAELKPWDTVHLDLISPYIKSIRQHQPGVTVINNNDSLTCTTLINPDIGLSEISEIRTFYLKDIALGNDEYIDKSSARVIHMFKNRL